MDILWTSCFFVVVVYIYDVQCTTTGKMVLLFFLEQIKKSDVFDSNRKTVENVEKVFFEKFIQLKN